MPECFFNKSEGYWQLGWASSLRRENLIYRLLAGGLDKYRALKDADKYAVWARQVSASLGESMKVQPRNRRKEILIKEPGKHVNNSLKGLGRIGQ